MKQIRNIAIIAHVDHGKTTLVDGMLKQTHTFRDNQAEMSQATILDSNELEREKGITILAKNTAVFYNDCKINIIDTPGHADFAGEVERVISMADGAILLVDAAEGPLPQTKFVLSQAFKQKQPLIVIINKIDRQDANPERVLSEIEELFLNLAEDEEALNFPVLYAIGREEKVWRNMPESTETGNLTPLFETIIETIPEPKANAELPFKMQVAQLDFDPHKGVLAIGRVSQGTVNKNQRLNVLAENDKIAEGQVQHLLTSQGLGRMEAEESQAGDIITIAGFPDIKIGQTLTDLSITEGLPMIKLTEPTLSISIAANTSPFLAKEGKFCTIRQIEERLLSECKTNIGLKVEKNPIGSGLIVSGRGELHLSILIESMRREGYEFEVGKPEVIIKEVEGQKQEPIEELSIEIDSEYVGVISEELGKRQAQLVNTNTDEKGITRMQYEISSCNLLGFRSGILSKTRGNGIFASSFSHYAPMGKLAMKLRNGALVATESGTATAYAIESIQQRGQTFVPPGTAVYKGMIIGISKQQNDLWVNICKAKKLTNFRSNADIAVPLDPPVILSLEQCLDFLEEDELLEVTPEALRLRKRVLDKKT